MSTKEYVWYASYGSNVSRERFLCYIQGGVPVGSKKYHKGCTDTSAPLADKGILINRELYFAKEAESWNRGGVCFLATEQNEQFETLGRMYRVTKEQFIEVVKQEIDYEGELTIDFDKVIEHGSTIVKPGSWYGNIVYLGKDTGYPIFTFTNEKNLTDINPPDAAYLRTIIVGLKEVFGLPKAEIESYLANKRGIKGYSIAAQLREIIEAKDL